MRKAGAEIKAKMKKYKWLRSMTNQHKNEDELLVQGEQQRIAIKLQAINNENKEKGGQKIITTWYEEE